MLSSATEGLISIHASVKEATCEDFPYIIISYFNPRLREGGDDKWTEQELQKLISIHASVKEATKMPLGRA